MNYDLSPQEIESISCRRILNSHVGFTNEFTIRLRNGNMGIAASPQGETISVFEDALTPSNTSDILDVIAHDRSLDRAITQADFDRFLQTRMGRFGRNNCWALSLAFFNASQFPLCKFWSDREEGARTFPRLCLNVLNGGHHAYTNPVLSDFPEYLLVPRFDDVQKVISDHAQIQQEVRKDLAGCERTMVNDNPVHRFKSVDNGECIVFLQKVLDQLGVGNDYDLMIDASAGDLRVGNGYRLSISNQSFKSTGELQSYWMNLIDEFSLGYLEDPFGEYDYDGWRALTGGQSKCKIIGDNFYSSDPERIENGFLNGYTHGAIVKPNQAGTVSTVLRTIEALKRCDQIAITSHRSISTESTFLSLVTILGGVRYMKIGPLYTDYSSAMRLNELIRLTGVELE